MLEDENPRPRPDGGRGFETLWTFRWRQVTTQNLSSINPEAVDEPDKENWERPSLEPRRVDVGERLGCRWHLRVRFWGCRTDDVWSDRETVSVNGRRMILSPPPRTYETEKASLDDGRVVHVTWRGVRVVRPFPRKRTSDLSRGEEMDGNFPPVPNHWCHRVSDR